MHQPAVLNWAIGDYVMESVIRAGGRATVYTARRVGANGLRALKVISIGVGADSRAVVDAERRGAELQQAFAQRHGLVPWVEAIGETPSCLYVAMELVPGEDLFDILARGPLSPAQALDIAVQLATFLERTHGFDVPARGPERIIHADLKPGNVRVRPDGRIRVLDFGIAKAMAERRLVTTQKWGTRQYMSPEWLETGTVDEHVDYWSLGVLLYEMLAGHRPFRRFERHDNQLEDAIRRRERPEALPGSVNLPILEVLGRLLAPRIDQRYANAVAIRAALEACRRGLPASAAPLTLVLRPDLQTAPGNGDAPATEPAPEALHALHANGTPAPLSRLDSPPTEPAPEGLHALRADVATPSPLAQLDALPTEPAPEGLQALRAGLAASMPLGRLDSPPTEPAPVVLAPAGPVAPVRLRDTVRKYIGRGILMYFAAVVASEGIACIAAERLRSDAAVADEHGLDTALQRRMELSHWTLFNAGVHLRADPVLKERLVSLADGVITNYRQEQPTVTRSNWEQARGWLNQAVGLYPGDDRLLSKMRYAEGQVQRLIGMQRADSNQAKNARQSFYAAIQRFQEAASLDPKSPDPYLGLMQTYVYGLGDVDAAVEAQSGAEKRGYRLNRRERASLGDAYRARGERTLRSVRDLKGDQQRDAYQRAQDDFKRCVESFGPIVEFANAADQLHRCEMRLAEVENHKTPWWKRLFGADSDFDLEIGQPKRADPPRSDSPDTSR